MEHKSPLMDAHNAGYRAALENERQDYQRIAKLHSERAAQASKGSDAYWFRYGLAACAETSVTRLGKKLAELDTPGTLM